MSSQINQIDQIKALASQLRQLEDRWRPDQGPDKPPGQIEAVVGPLRTRRVHEWFVEEAFTGEPWIAPLAILVDAVRSALQAAGSAGAGGVGLVVWIGKAVWPYAVSLDEHTRSHSVLVNPGDDGARVWAMDVAVRSSAVVAVVGDGSGLSLQATRRLQLASEAGRSLVMLARPPGELKRRSAAAFRWCVQSCSTGENPRWNVELVRSKDAMGVIGSRTLTQTCVEWRHGSGLVTVPAILADRTTAATRRIA